VWHQLRTVPYPKWHDCNELSLDERPSRWVNIRCTRARSRDANSSPATHLLKRWYSGVGVGHEIRLAEYIALLVEISARRGACFKLRKMVSESVSVIACSPPHWPSKRTGVMWVVIGDSYSTPGGIFRPDSFKLKRTGQQKILMPEGTRYQGTLAERPAGNLLMVPARFAMALQDDGWHLRQKVIWDKSGRAQCSSADDRVTRTHESIFMCTKQRKYFYDPDPIRVPKRGNGIDYRVPPNPLGTNAGSVWNVKPVSCPGRHPATFPPELVRHMLLPSCDDGAVVLDMFGGAGTTALVALQLGFSAITIDIDPDFTEEARNRIGRALALSVEGLAREGAATMSDLASAAD
jgi:DNA modification methylase